MNWLTTIFRTSPRSQQLIDMVGIRRRNNNTRNGLILSLLGAGIGVVAYGVMRNNNLNTNNMMQPVKQAVNQFRNPIN